MLYLNFQIIGQLAKKQAICVLNSLTFKRSRGKPEIERITDIVLADPRAKVIVLFMQVNPIYIYI